MTSHPRRVSGPARQHSLQQPQRRHHQVRRQKSAEDDRALQIRTTDPIRARRDNDRSNVERPKVRIAWGDDTRRGTVDEDSDKKVEVVACQIAATGKSRPIPTGRQPRIVNMNSVADKTCSTLLYSRQELAERLRLAWKQREANKSNIDVFLAHSTTEERSDSRLSSSSSVDRSPVRESPDSVRKVDGKIETRSDYNDRLDRSVELKKSNDGDDRRSSESIQSSAAGSAVNGCYIENETTTTLNLSDGAKGKRASFKSCSNAAFLEPVNDADGTFVPSSDSGSIAKKEVLHGAIGSINEQKSRRTNSAPPQRRANSVGATSRTQVSIVIEAPSIGKLEPVEQTIPIECIEPTPSPNKVPSLVGRPIKTVPAKRRAKSGKRRANSVAGKDFDAGRARVTSSDAKNSEVVTMVSLVSDADSDSEVEQNSPRDDKLISQLRSNLPTTPIIKSTAATCSSSNSIVRRPIKSVSFQQDSFDLDDADKRPVRIRPASVQVGRVIGSALPTPEEARSWRTDVTNLTISTTTTTIRQYYDSPEITDISLTDREKRCLVVPICDPRSDKKRKLLRTRSTPPARPNGLEKQASMHDDTEATEAPLRSRIPAVIENAVPVQQSTSILLQASVSKLVDETVPIPRNDEEPEAEAESVEPAFKTTKEKECWHLYRRMCDKGVCVSFDTVLRGMLTPTEYRLRRKETV